MAIDWERDWPIAAAAGLVVVGAIWASRARTEMVQRTVTLQPQPVDVAGIVQAQVAAQQAHFQTAAQLAGQYMQGVVALEESKLQAQVAMQEAQLQAQVAQQQIQAQLMAAELQTQAAVIQAQLQAQVAQQQISAQLQAAKLQSEVLKEAAKLQAEAAKAQAEAQARAVQAQAAAQQQSAFWTGLFGFLPFLIGLFSRQRTEQASLRRMLTSRPIRAQIASTRALLEAVS
jgi:hypothetical protein